MKKTVDELNQIVDTFAAKIGTIGEKDFVAKPLPHKWSRKEVLGHLIDSAHNNLRRFICGQYENTPKITYDQDFWVAANNYQQMDKTDVITMWKLMNQRIGAVLSNIPEQSYSRNCDTGSLHPIEWLAEDYVRHMKHHLNQIIPGSFDIVYK